MPRGAEAYRTQGAGLRVGAERSPLGENLSLEGPGMADPSGLLTLSVSSPRLALW